MTPSMSGVNVSSPCKKASCQNNCGYFQNAVSAKKVLAGMDGQLVPVGGQASRDFVFPCGTAGEMAGCVLPGN